MRDFPHPSRSPVPSGLREQTNGEQTNEQTKGEQTREPRPPASSAPADGALSPAPSSKTLNGSVGWSVGGGGLLSEGDEAQGSSSHVLTPEGERSRCGDTPDVSPWGGGETTSDARGLPPRGRGDTGPGSLESPSEAMASFRGQGWARVPDAIQVVLMSDELTPTEGRVLLVMTRSANWSPEKQKGIPATWLSAAAVARMARCHISAAERALARLGSGQWRERNRGGIAVHDRKPLCLLRDATEDEAAGVLENFTARPGKPPTVRIFRHPRFWRVNALVREEIDYLLAHPRSRLPWNQP